jgi:cysteine desulfurase
VADRRAYLDHASTSPLRPAARAAVRAWLDDGDGVHGDPGRIHHEGMVSRVAVEQAREELADLVGARSREVVFTSGATEAVAAATHGALHRDDRRHVVLAAVEHSAVRRSSERGDATVVGVDVSGRIDPDELLGAVRPDTALVHLQWGNHEVGTLQPVAEVVAACRDRGVLVHVDAAQAVGRVPVDFGALGADLLSLSGHKFGGPTGTGALLVRRGVRLPPLLVGGDQERARRAGLENLLGVVGLGAAATEAGERLTTESAASRRLTGRIRDAASTLDGVSVLGAAAHGALPHLVCLGLEGVEPQPVLLGLDRLGISVHSGSSCSSEALEPSPVLAAMGVDAERSLRVSVGWSTTDTDVDRFLDAVPRVLEGLRHLRTGTGPDRM